MFSRGLRFRHRTLRSLACGALALLFALGSPGADPGRTDKPEFKQTSQWLETIPAGGTLRVRNAFGNVHARFGGYENRVEVLATTQRLEDDLPELTVAVEPSDGGLDVRVDFSVDGAGSRPDPDATSDRVDLVIFVPQGVVYDVETRDGLIEAKKLRSDLVAGSRTGTLKIKSIAGRVQAKTARGEIEATLATAATVESQEFVTETGDIVVYLWEDADMTVELATSGEISTDFSLEMEHRRFEEPNKIAKAVVGRGGPELTLHSKQGRVRLLRLQRDFKPDRQAGMGTP